MAHGSRLVAHASRPVDRSAWLMAKESLALGPGPGGPSALGGISVRTCSELDFSILVEQMCGCEISKKNIKALPRGPWTKAGLWMPNWGFSSSVALEIMKSRFVDFCKVNILIY